MKILETQSATLTNHEVLSHLTSLRAKPRTTPRESQNFETVVKEVCDYLNPPSPKTTTTTTTTNPANPTTTDPASSSPLPNYTPPHYTPGTIRALFEALQPYELTKAEMVMICNLGPTDLGLLDCVVEECDLRFREEEQEGILGVVGNIIGGGEEMRGGNVGG